MITTQPYKGTSDWLPKQYQVQKYIFDTWRLVCTKFGYQEYLTPLIEYADLYRAKSGAVKDELFTLQDRAGRDLALRPEMTPSVTRMVASIYKQEPKPIRLFSIAPFYRNEAPQKGRTREFWQLNADIYGDESINSDLEILSLAIEIMLQFKAPKDSFKLYYSSRLLIDDFFANELKLPADSTQEIARIMDKFDKTDKKEVAAMLAKAGLDKSQIAKTTDFLEGKIEGPTFGGMQDITFLQKSLENLGYADYAQFKPSIVRGFEYYDGLIFEVFDLDPSNNRSLFGGGRYNGLADIFGMESFPATGFAPGNITTQLFLENWQLLPDFKDSATYYLPTLEGVNYTSVLNLANKLRSTGLTVVTDFEPVGISQGLRTANKLQYAYMLIFGQDEIANNTLTVKDLSSGAQETKPLESFLTTLS